MLAVSALAVAAAAVWRLSQGPVSVGFLAPHVAAALSRPEHGYRMEMGPVEAAWAGWNRLLRFRVTEARLMTREGEPLVETDGLEFVLGASDLLGGRIVPRDVELLGVRATLRRGPDGAIDLLAAADRQTEAEARGFDLRGLLGAGSAGGGIGLAGFGVRGAALRIVDDVMGMEWSISRLDLAFPDGAHGRVAEGAASLRLGETETDIGFTLSLPGEADGLSISMRLHGLRPRAVAAAHPLLAPLGHVTTPLSGSVAVHLAPDHAVAALEADLQGVGGAIVDLRDAERSVAVDGLVLRARGIDGLTRLEIDTVEVKTLNHTARLSGGGARQDGGASAFMHLEDVPPALLLPLLPPRFSAATALDAAVSGTVALTFNADFRPTAVDAGLTIGAGSLRVAGPEADTVAVQGGNAVVQADLEAGQILVESLGLVLDRGRVEAGGSARRQDAGWTVHLDGRASAVPVDDLRHLWPADVGSPGARAWVLSNLRGGHIDEARILADANVTLEPDLVFAAPAIDGSLSFSGVTARYWQPLPPFENIDGSAAFDSGSFSLTLSSGEYRDIAIVGGKVDFLDLDRETSPSRLAADVRFKGPMPRILEVLDRDPLGYARYLQMVPQAVRGDAAFRLRVGLPLVTAVALDDLSLEAEGEIANAYLPVDALHADLDRARIGVKANKTQIALSGGGSLDGRPATFDFQQRFSDRDPVETVYTLRTTIGDEARAALGFDFAPHLNGPVELDLAATEYRDETATYVVKAGLAASEIRLEPLNWAKSAGEPAWLEAEVRRGPEDLLEVSSIAAAGPGLELAGRGRFDIAGGRLLTGSLDRLRLGERTDLAVHVEQLSDGVVSIRAQGPGVDLSPYLDDDEAGEPDEPGGLDRLAIRIDADRAWLGGDAPLQGLGAEIRFDRGRISEALADARMANGRAVSASLRPDRDGTALRIEAQDAGALLAALGWYRNMKGGLLRVTASSPAGSEDDYGGSLVIEDFRIRNAPVLTRLLAAASLTGIRDALSGDSGLEFERLKTPFKMQDRRIEVGPGRAVGNAIGVTFEGGFDRDRQTVAINGVLAPANYINRVLRQMPVIGDILTGGGEGLFAANYELSGPVDDPRTTVNPLSVLAPGILRNLFDPLLGADGGGRDGKAAQ